jgi:putative FmdB family regulatory protein
MPLYEYRCADCHTSFEKLTRRELADSVSCPECGSVRSKRLISVFASFTQTSDGLVATSGGGCACGGHCGCGGH